MNLSQELETLIRGRKARGASKAELGTLEAALEVVKKATAPSFFRQVLGVLSSEPVTTSEIHARLRKRSIDAGVKSLSTALNDHMKQGRVRREMVTLKEGALPRWAYAITPAGEDFLGDGE